MEADAAHGLGQGLAGFAVIGAAALQVEQAAHNGKIISHPVLQFAKQKLALRQFGVSFVGDPLRSRPEAFRYADQQNRGQARDRRGPPVGNSSMHRTAPPGGTTNIQASNPEPSMVPVPACHPPNKVARRAAG